MRSAEMNTASKPRIRTKLIVFLTTFVTCGLVLLLLFQTFFLDDLYEWSKTRTVKTAANEIASALSSDDMEEYVDYWSIREDCEVYVIDATGQVLYSRGAGSDMERMNTGQLRAYYDAAAESEDGAVFSKSQIDLIKHGGAVDIPPMDSKPGGERQPPLQGVPDEPMKETETSERVVYATLAPSGEDVQPLLVLVTSVLTPVGATVRVLQVQLVIAIVLFIGLTVLLAWFMAKSIASPIIDINHAAKRLASGSYESPPEGSYREVAELRETLAVIDGELRKSEQLQRDLIANVSHDLRTPLTMIIGYSEAIRDLPGEDSAENIQVVIDEAGRLSRLVNDLLDLSRLQSGTQSFDMVPIVLTELLRDVVERCCRMTQQDGYHIELIAEDEAAVSGDEVRLSQVIYNLLINALTYTGEDKTVRVRQTVTADSVRIAFTDSGKGIPEEELSNIWLRYYQVHSHEKRRDSMNSGLGLSIVHALVQRHGGTCGVESAVGRGSTFWFELPRLK